MPEAVALTEADADAVVAGAVVVFDAFRFRRPLRFESFIVVVSSPTTADALPAVVTAAVAAAAADAAALLCFFEDERRLKLRRIELRLFRRNESRFMAAVGIGSLIGLGAAVVPIVIVAAVVAATGGGGRGTAGIEAGRIFGISSMAFLRASNFLL